MLTCKKATELLLDFLDNTLEPRDKDAMHSHLQDCSLCKQFMESYKKTTVVCRQMLDKKAPAGMGQRLMDFLRRETGKAPR